MMHQVPTLDMRRLDTDTQAFVAELGEAYRTFGFCCFTGHGVSMDAMRAAYDAFRAFFALPEDVKRKYHLPGKAGMRGFTPFKVETAKTSQHPDLKEFWHIGRDERPEDGHLDDILLPNVWPAEVPGFKEAGLRLYREMEAFGHNILRAMALNIGLPEDFFRDKTRWGNSILRALHYPPVNPDDLPCVRAEAHEDISLITLLIGAQGGGLELLTRKGEWLPIMPEGDGIVVNVGDMMQRLTNHVYPSTTHRVVNPEGEQAKHSRYSLPFFFDPDPEFLIETLPSCITPDNPNRYPAPIRAHDYLMERLGEIKLT